MARKALLIGTSQYLDGFKPLKSATQDVGALAKLLNNPEIGRFDEVQVETDLDSSILAEKIETWYLGHAKDDFVLLFLVGHGVKDADRKLHFAATNTKKVGEKLITTTAIAASSISNWMGGSKAKRQIVILNCCFSGAFGDLVPMDEGTIDVEEAIAAEGRVVMTSTSSMDYAFERLIGGELSVYGHYLEEGLRTGAAAAADSDEITIDRLHQYVSRKVQEEAPSMVPKIFAKGEGYQLRIAKVALGDPTIQYRKEVDRLVQMFGEPIEGIARFKLQLLQEKLDLHDFQVNEIEDQVLEPIRQRKKKIIQYRNFFTSTVQKSYPFDELHLQILSEIKQLMGLLDEDVAIVEADVLSAIQPELLIKELVTVEFDRLEDLLQKKQWKEANDETLRLLLCLADRQAEDWLLVGNIRNFSQDDLNTIDALWSNASQGRFGFGIQARIFEEKIESFEYLGQGEFSKSEAWQEFDAIVKWRSEAGNSYEFSLNAPEGHLPHWRKLISGWNVRDRGISFLKRGLDCPIVSFKAIDSEDIEVELIVPEVQTNSEVPLIKGDLGGSGTETKSQELEKPIVIQKPIVPRLKPIVPRLNPIVLGVDPIPLAPLKRGNWSWEETTFKFETVKVNNQGEMVDRKTDERKCFRQDLGNNTFIDMVVIPGGQFMNVKIPPFLISKTPITEAQWDQVNRLPQINIELPHPSQFKKSQRHPFECISFWQANEFCKRLAKVTQQDYRLPSEVQWEYACRSGTMTDFSFGDVLTKEIANYDSSETTDVEKYFANSWGLYDMHGNVYEWCVDHWRSTLEIPLKDSNPYFSSDNDSRRVIRGGSWFFGPSQCKSAYRHSSHPSNVSSLVGFRLVCFF